MREIADQHVDQDDNGERHHDEPEPALERLGDGRNTDEVEQEPDHTAEDDQGHDDRYEGFDAHGAIPLGRPGRRRDYQKELWAELEVPSICLRSREDRAKNRDHFVRFLAPRAQHGRRLALDQMKLGSQHVARKAQDDAPGGSAGGVKF